MVFDLLVIGCGIVGLATAWQFQRRRPGARVLLIDKEASIAFHQTGRNSGVLHSGIYYRPGSLRANNCRVGKQALVDFCQEYGIAHDICGKVIVAVDDGELPALQRIFERGQANGVVCEMIDRDRLHAIEPHASGVRAIWVPETGIVDYPGVCRKLAELITASGGEVRLNTAARQIAGDGSLVRVVTTAGEFSAKQLVNCAGLHSDRVARMSGAQLDAQIVPFRGEYYELKPAAHHLCRNLIYPVPNPEFPFLGVHFTRLIHGGIECGPNAVLALAREGYTWRDINLNDLFETLRFRGFRRLTRRYWSMGLDEMGRSLSKAAFVRALQRLIPEITADQLEAAPSGVRAQAVGSDGFVIDDFLIESHGRVVNVCNAPSPAATASLNIGNLIADRLLAE
ncbi:MAG: L-2-hydroxyglutarate oxidase [Planctomycetes bacterium]|nr:L-2-hydroxyglutarate oxidase [Planctomycetota bacterium]